MLSWGTGCGSRTSRLTVRKILQRLRERLRACVEKRIVAAEGAGP